MQKQIRDLQKTVDELERRITSLEAGTIANNKNNTNVNTDQYQKMNKAEKKKKRREAREKAIEWGQQDLLRSKIMKEVTKAMKDYKLCD